MVKSNKLNRKKISRSKSFRKNRTNTKSVRRKYRHRGGNPTGCVNSKVGNNANDFQSTFYLNNNNNNNNNNSNSSNYYLSHGDVYARMNQGHL
jgi:hypothetical protein